MLFVGYFEGLDSQRGTAWRCADSRSLQAFLGYRATPDHSSLSRIRQRLPEVVHEKVFAFLLHLAERNSQGLLAGQTVAVDATLLEANAALKQIRRRNNGDDWKAYVTKLAAEAGLKDPTDAELRRFDKTRKNKKVSNADWQSPSDPDSRIAKLKDGTTHLAYKAEHVVDLDSNLVLSAEIHAADQADSATLPPSLTSAQLNLLRAGNPTEIKAIVVDQATKNGKRAPTALPGAADVHPQTRADAPASRPQQPAAAEREAQQATATLAQRVR